MGNSQTSLNIELSHVKLPEHRRCEGGSLCSPDMTVRVLAYPSQPTFNNSVEAPFMYRVQLSYIRELYLKNYQYTDIERQTKHTTSSIERYIQDFTRVVMLLNQGLNIADIRQATKMSERLISEYIELYKKYDSENNSRLKEIKSKAIVVKKKGVCA